MTTLKLKARLSIQPLMLHIFHRINKEFTVLSAAVLNFILPFLVGYPQGKYQNKRLFALYEKRNMHECDFRIANRRHQPYDITNLQTAGICNHSHERSLYACE
jgi:hypothetical protein